MIVRIYDLSLLSIVLLCMGCESVREATRADVEEPPVRDLMWVWGNPEMAEPGSHDAATFAQASPAERAKLLGVPNVIMAGMGVPRDEAKAELLSQQVAHCPRLVWEISTDTETIGPPFIYRDMIARVCKLANRYPRIEGVLLDDMTSVGIDRGFKPEHIREVHRLLGRQNAQIEIWGVVYTMNLNRQGIEDYIRELDVINLWVWHAKDIPEIEKHVAYLESCFPGKPIVLGLYLYDFGENRRMPMELLKRQCETALNLARTERIQGMVFLTIENDAEAVAWTADWIAKVGDTPVER